jgi:hypothetical protein
VVAVSVVLVLYPLALWATRERTGLVLLLKAVRGRQRRR